MELSRLYVDRNGDLRYTTECLPDGWISGLASPKDRPDLMGWLYRFAKPEANL